MCLSVRPAFCVTLKFIFLKRRQNETTTNDNDAIDGAKRREPFETPAAFDFSL